MNGEKCSTTAALLISHTRGQQWTILLLRGLHAELANNLRDWEERARACVCVQTKENFLHLKSDMMKAKRPSKPCLTSWPLTLISPGESIGLFACLLSHMSVQTPFGWFMLHKHTHTENLCSDLLMQQSWDHIHKSMRSHDGPECVQSGDNCSPRAMSLRSSWQDTRRQMLRAKATLSSPVWNTCVQSDNDTRAQFAHIQGEEVGPGVDRLRVTPSVLTVCPGLDAPPWRPTFDKHQSHMPCMIWISTLKIRKLKQLLATFFDRTCYSKALPTSLSKTSQLISSEPLAHYKAHWCGVGLIGTTGGRGCVGIREQKDPSPSSKRINS